MYIKILLFILFTAITSSYANRPQQLSLAQLFPEDVLGGEFTDSNYDNELEDLDESDVPNFFPSDDLSQLNYRNLQADKDNENSNGIMSNGRDKKSITTCKINKIVKYHSQEGYEFLPTQYTAYECVPNSASTHNSNLGPVLYDHEICHVNDHRCITVKKDHFFLKREENSNCWNWDVKPIDAGCKCSPLKFHHKY